MLKIVAKCAEFWESKSKENSSLRAQHKTILNLAHLPSAPSVITKSFTWYYEPSGTFATLKNEVSRLKYPAT